MEEMLFEVFLFLFQLWPSFCAVEPNDWTIFVEDLPRNNPILVEIGQGLMEEVLFEVVFYICSSGHYFVHRSGTV